MKDNKIAPDDAASVVKDFQEFLYKVWNSPVPKGAVESFLGCRFPAAKAPNTVTCVLCKREYNTEVEGDVITIDDTGITSTGAHIHLPVCGGCYDHGVMTVARKKNDNLSEFTKGVQASLEIVKDEKRELEEVVGRKQGQNARQMATIEEMREERAELKNQLVAVTTHRDGVTKIYEERIRRLEKVVEAKDRLIVTFTKEVGSQDAQIKELKETDAARDLRVHKLLERIADLEKHLLLGTSSPQFDTPTCALCFRIMEPGNHDNIDLNVTDECSNVHRRHICAVCAADKQNLGGIIQDQRDEITALKAQAKGNKVTFADFERRRVEIKGLTRQVKELMAIRDSQSREVTKLLLRLKRRQTDMDALKERADRAEFEVEKQAWKLRDQAIHVDTGKGMVRSFILWAIGHTTYVNIGQALNEIHTQWLETQPSDFCGGSDTLRVLEERGQEIKSLKESNQILGNMKDGMCHLLRLRIGVGQDIDIDDSGNVTIVG